MGVTVPMKQYAEQKASKLTKYYDRIQEIEVVFDPAGASKDKAAKDQIQVEIMVHAEHRNMFVARHSVGDAYACVDGCCHKLERQLSDHKKKTRNRKHSAAPVKQSMRRTGS